MKKLLMVLNFLLSFGLLMAQKPCDYVVLIHLNPYLPGDTVYGDILPQNITNCQLKIKLLNDDKETYYAEKVKCFQAKGAFFASIPYLDTRVFAKRISEGPISLFFYDSKFHYFGGGAIGGALGAISMVGNTRYFIKVEKQYTYIEVPHSSRKIRETIAPLFKDNKECYNKFFSNEFREKQIVDIVNEYNSTIVSLAK